MSRINERLTELGKLERGWLGSGEGEPFDPVALEWAGGVIKAICCAPWHPEVDIFPTPDGGLQVEWDFRTWSFWAEFDLPATKVTLGVMNHATTADKELVTDLSTEESVAEAVRFLAETRP